MDRRKEAFDKKTEELRLKEAFDTIEADSRLRESTKQYLSSKRRRQGGRPFTLTIRRTFAAVCTLLALVLGIGGYRFTQTPVSYVSIDINPSIELALNRFDRVVFAEAYNPEGEEILQELSLKGKKYNDALDAIVASDAMKPYLTSDAELVFTVAAEEQRERHLIRGVQHCLKHVGCGSHSVGADLALVSAAHDCGLSLGKYYAYLQLAEYDDTVTPDSCRDMSISQIQGLISEHQHGMHSEGEGHHGEGTGTYGPEAPADSQEPDPFGEAEEPGDRQEVDQGCDVEPEKEGHHGQKHHH